jgi:radical SAM protein with 4Fe4S-binding SPASM domain
VSEILFKKLMSEKKEKIRILVTRLKWGEKTREVLSFIKENFGDAQIDLVTLNRLEDNLASGGFVCRTIILPDDYSIPKIVFDRQLISGVKKKKYDILIIPIKDIYNKGYEWVKIFAYRSKVKNLFVCDGNLNFSKIEIGSTIADSLKNCIYQGSKVVRNILKSYEYGLSLKSALNAPYYLRNSLVGNNPKHLTIEPINRCNLNCPFCECGQDQLHRPKGMMSLKAFKRILERFPKGIETLYLNSWGESFLNPDIYDMIKYAQGWSGNISIDTNGTHIDPEAVVKSGLQNLIFSVDGITQASYEKLRAGGNLSEVLANMKEIIAWKKKLKSSYPKVVFKFIVMKHNEHEMSDAEMLSKSIGADECCFNMFTARSVAEEMIGFLPVDEKYSRYVRSEMEKGRVRVKYRTLNNCCSWLWTGMTIYWDGSVYPCCKFPYNFGMTSATTAAEDTSFGNIFDVVDCMQIWNSVKAQEFRKKLQEGELASCRECYMEEHHD